MPDENSVDNAPHPRDLRNKWSVAALAATAALVGAGAGVWGSVIVADKQITANRDLAATQFRQDQRMKVYSDVVTTMQDFQDDLISVRIHFDDAAKGLYDKTRLSYTTRGIVDHYNAIRPKVAAVKLIGGKDVVEAADELEQGFIDCLRRSYDLGYAYMDQPVDPAKVNSIADGFDQCEPKMQPLVDTYLTESRKDLGLT